MSWFGRDRDITHLGLAALVRAIAQRAALGGT